MSIAIFIRFITIGTRIKPSACLQKKGLKSDFYSGLVLSLLEALFVPKFCTKAHKS